VYIDCAPGITLVSPAWRVCWLQQLYRSVSLLDSPPSSSYCCYSSQWSASNGRIIYECYLFLHSNFMRYAFLKTMHVLERTISAWVEWLNDTRGPNTTTEWTFNIPWSLWPRFYVHSIAAMIYRALRAYSTNTTIVWMSRKALWSCSVTSSKQDMIMATCATNVAKTHSCHHTGIGRSNVNTSLHCIACNGFQFSGGRWQYIKLSLASSY